MTNRVRAIAVSRDAIFYTLRALDGDTRRRFPVFSTIFSCHSLENFVPKFHMLKFTYIFDDNPDLKIETEGFSLSILQYMKIMRAIVFRDIPVFVLCMIDIFFNVASAILQI